MARKIQGRIHYNGLPREGQRTGKLRVCIDFLSDFFIGGFASARCDAIITRDRGIYKKYFPDLVGYENCLS
jgi:hypothetical protein